MSDVGDAIRELALEFREGLNIHDGSETIAEAISYGGEYSLVKTLANCSDSLDAALHRIADGLFAVAEAIDRHG